MQRKNIAIIGLVLIAVIAFGFYILKPKPVTSDHTEVTEVSEENGIYCYTSSRNMCFLSSDDYQVLNKVLIYGGLNVAAVSDKKVYLTIRGDHSKAGKEIAVFRNGNIIKSIELEHILPENIIYNEHDGKAYVGHILINHTNYITVINTKNDTVEHVIPYHDKVIEDMAICGNKLYVSSWYSRAPGEASQIDTIDLDDYCLINTFPLDYTVTSMIVLDNTIYGIRSLSDEPVVYALNAENGNVEKRIQLEEQYPWEIYKNEQDGKIQLYVSHYNVDNGTGDSISCIDPETSEVIDVLPNALSAEVLGFNGSDILICEQKNNRLSIMRDSKLVRKIGIGRVMAIATVSESSE
jgi:hypothetical protein